MADCEIVDWNGNTLVPDADGKIHIPFPNEGISSFPDNILSVGFDGRPYLNANDVVGLAASGGGELGTGPTMCMKLSGCWEALCCDDQSGVTGTVTIEMLPCTYVDPSSGVVDAASVLGRQVVYAGTGRPIARRKTIATINANGCWESCELPCNDSLVPGTSLYKITEEAAGAADPTTVEKRITLFAANCCAMGVEEGATIDIHNPPGPTVTAAEAGE